MADKRRSSSAKSDKRRSSSAARCRASTTAHRGSHIDSKVESIAVTITGDEPEENDDRLEEGNKLLQDLIASDYTVRLHYSNTHHEKLVDKKEKSGIIKTVQAALKKAEEYEKDDNEDLHSTGGEIAMQAHKLLTVINANDFLESGKEKDKKSALENGRLCGWKNLREEPWRALFVQKACGAKVGYAMAVMACKDHDDLVEAIKSAPNAKPRFSKIPGDFKPPVKPTK